jgi:hypothetical protein
MNKITEPPYIPNSKVWKKILTKNYEFTYIDSLNKIPSNALWSTSCSKTKSKLKKGYPSEFYLSKYNLLFYKYVESLNFDYGVISDKYGIHLQNEKLQNYDIHPTKLSFEDKLELGQKIKVKVKNSGYENLIFYYPSPLMSKPYFQMLWYADIPVYYISNIKMLEKRI